MSKTEYKTQFFIQTLSTVMGTLALFMLVAYPLMSIKGMYDYHIQAERLKVTQVKEQLHLETMEEVNNTPSRLIIRKRLGYTPEEPEMVEDNSTWKDECPEEPVAVEMTVDTSMKGAEQLWNSMNPLNRMAAIPGMHVLCYGAEFRELNEPEKLMVKQHVADPSSTNMAKPIQYRYRTKE